jgi:Tc toxin complex TcA C-terminal TcB-binding domain/Neuraminidase-like domain/Salmonella virulence plasmid 28.1kDa A protein
MTNDDSRQPESGGKLQGSGATPSRGGFVVHGHVRHADGTPGARLMVRAFNRDLRSEDPLGQNWTDEAGAYRIDYSPDAFARAGENDSADLIVRVYGADPARSSISAPLAESPTLFNAPADATIDLVLGNEDYRGPAEFDQILRAIQPLLQGVAIAELTEDESHHDLSFLAGETGFDTQRLGTLVKAYRFASQTAASADAFYGMIREGLPETLPALLRTSPDAQIHALTQAVADTLIAAQSPESISALVATLRGTVVAQAINRPAPGQSHSLGELLTLATPSAETQAALLNAYVEHQGPIQDFWKSLGQDPQFQDPVLVARLQLTLQLGALTANQVPVVKALLDLHDPQPIASPRDLARFDSVAWSKLIEQSGGVAVVPSSITGKTDQERLDKYAATMARVIEAAFPTAVVASRVAADNLPARDDLATFFANAPQFELGRSHAGTFVAENPAALKGVKDPGAMTAQLGVMQRIFKLTPHYDEMRVLLADGQVSARSLAAMGRNTFTARYSGQFGADRAADIYGKASQVSAGALAIASGFAPLFNNLNPSVIPPSANQVPGVPDWQTLFGSLDLCACGSCSAVDSPAAYLVDLLQFLKARNLATLQPAALQSALLVLLKRRPDLGEVQLSCENTDTAIPYIDLVNELLENLVVPSIDWTTPLTDAERAVLQTTGTALERAITPEHVVPAAYATLALQVYPWSLPFDLALEEARGYLGVLHVKRADLMATLDVTSPPDDLVNIGITAEYLGLAASVHAVLVGLDGHITAEHWGDTGAGWIGDLSSVPTFLLHSGLSFADLQKLVATAYVGQGGKVTLVLGANCDTTTATLEGLDEATLERIHRFVRLWRALAWSMAGLDRAITAFAAASFDDAFLRRIAHVKRITDSLGLPVVEVLSWWARLDTSGDPSADPSLYAGTFQNRTVFPLATGAVDPFAINPAGTELAVPGVMATPGIPDSIQAALRLSADDFALLTVPAVAQSTLGLATSEISDGNFNLANLSHLFRVASFARAHGLAIADLLSLKALTGIDPFDAAHTENALVLGRHLDAIRATPFSITDLDQVLRDWLRPGLAGPDQTARATTLRSLRDALARAAAGNQGLTDATGNSTRARLGQILAPADVDHAMAILDGSSADTDAAKLAFIAAQLSSAANPALFIHDLAAAQIALVGPNALLLPADRFAFVLRLAAAYLAQNAALVQGLGTALKLDVAVAAALLDLIRVPGSATSARNAFLASAFLAADPKTAPDPALFADQYAVLALLQKVATVLGRFRVTADQLGWLVTYGLAAGWLDLRSLPTAPAASGAALYPAWRRLADLFGLRDGLPSGATVLGNTFAAASSGVPQAQLLAGLATALGWNPDDLSFSTGGGGFALNYPDAFKDERALVRLRAAFALFGTLGASAASAFAWAQPTLSLDDAANLRRTVKAQFSATDWLTAAQPVADSIRMRSRDALVAYLLAHPEKFGVAPGADVNMLYNTLLEDPEMNACQLTSRIKQAIGSVQLFVQRCQMGLEAGHIPSPAEAKDWHDLWAWMHSYVVWQANRQVFLYPENYLEPELRREKSAFFLDLEQQLQKSDLTKDAAEDAFHTYLEKLDSVARLDVQASYHEVETDSNGNRIVDILHVFARAYGQQKTYYYRQRIDSARWTAWEKIEVDIPGDQLLPIIYNRRLRLVWPTFRAVADSSQAPIHTPQIDADYNTPNPRQHLEIQLGWTEYNRRLKKWAPKKHTEESIQSSLPNPSDHFFRAQVQGDGSLWVWYEEANPSTVLFDFWGTVISLPFAVVPAFVFAGCNEDAAISATLDFGVATPNGTGASGTMYDGSGPLFLFSDTSDSGSVQTLGHTPSGFEVVPPPPFAAQAPEDPLFYKDPQRTFFIEPEEKQVPIWIWQDPFQVSPIAIDQAVFHFYEQQPPVLVNPGDPISNPNPGDPPVFAPSYSLAGRPAAEDARLKVSSQVGALLGIQVATPGAFAALAMPGMASVRAVGGGSGGNALLSAATGAAQRLGATNTPANQYISQQLGSALGVSLDNTPRLTRQSAILPASVTAAISQAASVYGSSVIAQPSDGFIFPIWISERFYRFGSFQHPYVCEFIRQLNRDGIDGVMQRTLQVDSHSDYFVGAYAPQFDVDTPYPRDEVDFDYQGAYSLYNWELFYHAPMLIAERLKTNRRFQEARDWFQYIFDPTDFSSYPIPQRYWKTRPFFEATAANYASEQIAQLLANLAAGTDSTLDLEVREWRRNPFDPHTIARMRPTAYQKATVMRYLDNLIAWGDQLFGQDTIEAINQATQLYILAAEILGPRPQNPKPASEPAPLTYDQLAPKLDSFSEALIQLENLAGTPDGINPPFSTDPLTTLSPVLYFCVPQNQQLLSYWDTIADRLFKIRNCRNIAGVFRQLPLFEPPINPALLVAAAAAGVDIGTALSAINTQLPKYRFSVMIERALQLCADVRVLGGALLAALEKSDAEAMATLRATNELSLLAAIRQSKALQVKEAQTNIDALTQAQAKTQARLDHYRGLLFLSAGEATHLRLAAEAAVLGVIASSSETLAAVLHLVPEISIGIAGFGGSPTVSLGFGGGQMGAAFEATARGAQGLMAIKNWESTTIATLAGYQRRQEDWSLQIAEAKIELLQIGQQLAAAQIHLQVAQSEIDAHDVQIANAQSVDAQFHSKFTNQQLYDWMVGQISGVYSSGYQLAHDLAKRAERCFQYELAQPSASYIQFGYFDNLRQGLLSGDLLQADLRRLEAAYLDQNAREYEITRHISLAALDPVALVKLRENGQCDLTIPETFFDADYPGHYLRRLRSVGLTIPCVAGPYTGVNATLTLVGNKVRMSTSATPQYKEQGPNDPRFGYAVGAIQSIATSSAQNDSGLFELSFRDERYLPFEGAGAISVWHLEMPLATNQLDFSTIADVVLHLRYTARDARASLHDGALAAATGVASASGVRLVSAKNEFATEWFRFLHPAPASPDDQVLSIDLSADRFPFNTRGRTVSVATVDVFGSFTDGGPFTILVAPPSVGPPVFGPPGALNLDAAGKLHIGSAVVAGAPGLWSFKLKQAAAPDFKHLTADLAQDLMLVFHYTLT